MSHFRLPRFFSVSKPVRVPMFPPGPSIRNEFFIFKKIYSFDSISLLVDFCSTLRVFARRWATSGCPDSFLCPSWSGCQRSHPGRQIETNFSFSKKSLSIALFSSNHACGSSILPMQTYWMSHFLCLRRPHAVRGWF